MRAQTMAQRLALMAFAFLIAEGAARAGEYVQTNLVSDMKGVAEKYDPNLINPWGISYSTGSPFWVSDQGTGVSTLYTVNPSTNQASLNSLVVTIPNLGGASPVPGAGPGPTGQVAVGAPGIVTDSTTDFQVTNPVGKTGEASFIFANLDGSISAWSGKVSGTEATIEASVSGASFTGLAIGNSSTGPEIYAADQNSGNVDVFNSKWVQTGTLTDPNLPAGFTAFNVQNIGGTLFVTYANPNVAAGGVVDEFSTDGTLIKRLITDPSGDHLNTPWGLALAPSSFGQFGGDLLIGNNDVDGFINAYSLSGVWQGTLLLNGGQPFSQTELWGITFGNGAGAGSKNILYFAAGLPNQTDGLFGSLQPAPEPSSAVLGLIALGLSTAGWKWNARRRSMTS